MSREFSRKFDGLAEDLKKMTTDQEEKENKVAEAKRLQAWINEFEAKLDSTLAI